MKRQKQDTGLIPRVYSYGCVPSRVAPVLNEDRALTQLRLANRLWNVLVRIERTRDTNYKRIMLDEKQIRINELKEERKVLDEEKKRLYQNARKKKDVVLGEIPIRLKAIREELKPLIDYQKATSKERHEQKSTELHALMDITSKRIKKARQAAASLGLFWGTYNDIVQRMDAGRKQGGELHFQKYDCSGTLTAQIIGGTRIARCQIPDGHTFFQLHSIAEGNDSVGIISRGQRISATPTHLLETGRGFVEANRIAVGDTLFTGGRVLQIHKSTQRWQYAYMRIGSHEDRAPIWLGIPIIYHREIPQHGDIKSVSMSRRVVDDQVRWQLNVTVMIPKPAPKTEGPTVAVDIGWRLLPEGVRVAYWYDSEGKHGQVLVPQSDIDLFTGDHGVRGVARLRSVADRLRDDFVPTLAGWLKDQSDLPEVWQEKTAFLVKWKSGKRLSSLITWWRDHRLDGDKEAFHAAVQWRRDFLHVDRWARNLHEQMVLKVRDQYRVFASELSKKYSTVVLENFDLTEVIQKTEADPDFVPSTQAVVKPYAKAGSNYRQIVGPGKFRLVLLSTCNREGLQIVKRPAEFTTRKCHVCGANYAWNQAESVMHSCEICHSTWDQDFNAAVNLLQDDVTQRTLEAGA